MPISPDSIPAPAPAPALKPVPFTIYNAATGAVVSSGQATGTAAQTLVQAGQAVFLGVAGKVGVDFYDPKFKTIRPIPVMATRQWIASLEARIAALEAQAAKPPQAATPS